MAILELCAGYGGIGLAVEPLVGDKVTHVAEVTPHACKILEERFPGAENIGDMTVYDWSSLVGRTDIITAGFPCQDISNAGSREGINGKRSGVWKNVAEATRVLRPRYLFLENVSAIRTRGLDVVCQDLAEIGYDLRWTTLRASDVGGLTTGTGGSGSPLPLFPTPKASDGPHGGPNQRNGKGEYDALPSMVVHLLPTPTARDWKSGASNQHGKNSRPLSEVVLLFKTPTAQLGRNGAAQHPDKRKAGGHGPTLDDEVVYLLPTPTTSDGKGGPGTSPNRKGGMNLRTAVSKLPAPEDNLIQDWGKYEPAIRRQEAWMGRPAPIPTEVGPRGGRRLTARFAEWLMGLPDGWVTDTPGLSRADQLHAIGNGVVPRQAYNAFRSLLEDAKLDTPH